MEGRPARLSERETAPPPPEKGSSPLVFLALAMTSLACGALGGLAAELLRRLAAG
ncbi:MAG: hypothetical protein LBQ12_02380 [Deltaproteobacteria bacterium]|jgi:hypothetical protein|nr:hypothetical protein [Deltaproteobacteria bacterium]